MNSTQGSVLPLQTHGVFDEEWIPPRSRSQFVTYTKADEYWLRPLGAGTIRKSLDHLFDVRLPDETLVGYCEANPLKCGHYPWAIPVIEDRDSLLARRSPRMESPSVKITSISLETHTWMFGDKRFTGWLVSTPEDAGQLILAGFIKVLGCDNLRRFIWNLQREWNEKRFQHGGPR